MAIELKQQLRLSQQLVMTPQLQQAIKLLQLNRLELVGLVQQELEENPVLEEFAEIDDEGEGSADEYEAAAEPQPAAKDERPGDEVAAADAQKSSEEITDAEKIADWEWQEYLSSNPQTSQASGGVDDRPSIDATLARRDTLTEHLVWQLQLTELPIDEEVAARFIIGNLDERGYLQATISELARQSGMSEATVESALARVQELDPVGVGARDLRECLLVQVRTLKIEDPLVLRILDECIDTLIKRDFRGVARALDVTVSEVVRAAEIIGRLEPRPGRAFGGDEPVYIIPDIYVHKVNDEFHIVLNDDGMPRLRINGLYRDVLSRGNSASKDTKE